MIADINVQRGLGMPPRPARVLVVDDDPGDAKLLRLILEDQVLEVCTCTDYESALRYLETAPFDFVLVSQGSSAFEGRAVLERAIELDRHRPVMVTTRSLDMQCYLEAMHLGAIDYLEKPVPPAELLSFVRSHLHHRESRMHGSA